MSQKLTQLYYKPTLPSSLGGQQHLHDKAADIPQQLTKEWLSTQDAYTLHKTARKNFLRRPTIVSGANVQYQADLVDMHKYSAHNSGYNYILTLIDVFTKFGWCVPLKTKQGKEISKELGKILSESPCKDLQTDKGKEFYNSSVKTLLKKLHIRHFSTENDDIKASIVERFNRTIQSKLHRWFTYTNTYEWTQVIDDITKGYNATKHSATKNSPKDAAKANQEDIWLNLHFRESLQKHKKNDINVNDPVRISKYKHVFAKGYDQNWSSEVFFVDKIEKTFPITYRLRDQKEEKIHGTYYANELQKVSLPKTFIIEDIIQERGNKRNKEYFVSYRGYPSKFNEWISAEQLIKLR